MSMHKIPLTEYEREGLEKHGLKIGTTSQLSDVFRLGMAWQAAQSVPPKPDYSVTQLQRMKSLMGVLGLATDESLEAFCLDADRQLSRVITAMEKFMATQSVPVVGEVVNWEAFPSYLLDHQEGSIITEENLQFWLSAMIKDPQYNKPNHSISAAELERLRKDAEHVPDGFVLVPAEPTPEICEAIEEALKQDGFDPVHVGECSKRAIWIDAIDAAIAAEGEK